MTHFNKYFDKPYVGHWDLREDGDTVLTIDRVEQGELHKPGATKTERKPLLFFKNATKPMVLNATNVKTIASLYGDHVEKWAGQKIALYRTTTHGPGGGQVECVRVRPTKPAATRRGAADEEASDA